MKARTVELAGWVPALVFPGATFLQLWELWHATNPVDVNALTWGLFGLANLCLYVYSEKYLRPQALIGFLLTALLDFLIVGQVLLSP